jgi:hypothetical protein
MKYLKLFENFNNVSDFVEVGDFITTIKNYSQTYGEYNVTKIITINLLDAVKSGQKDGSNIGLEVGNVYSLFVNNVHKIGTMKFVDLKSEIINGRDIFNVEIYIPLKEFNDKKLPIGVTKSKVVKFLNKNKDKYGFKVPENI